MPRRQFFAVLFCLLALLGAGGGSTWAQTPGLSLTNPLGGADSAAEPEKAPEDERPAPVAQPLAGADVIPKEVAREWTRVISAAATYVSNGRAIPSETELHSELLRDLIAAAQEIRRTADATAAERRALLDALPPKPSADSGETEPEQVAEVRSRITSGLNFARSRSAAATLAITRANQLIAEVAGLERRELADQLNQRQTDPWTVAAFRQGLGESLDALTRIVASPISWRASLDDEQWRSFRTKSLPVLAGGLAAAFAVGFFVRAFLLRRFGYDDGPGHVTQARRLGAAVVLAVADGLIPALLMAILYFWSRHALGALGAPLFGDAIAGAAIGLAIISLAYAGLSAALTPERPDWRLLPVSSAAARAIRHRGVLFAVVGAVDVFVWTALAHEPKSPEFMTIYAIVACSLRALALAPLLRGRLWRLMDAPTGNADAQPEPRRRNPLWLLARILLGLAAFGAVAAAGLGYADLALFVARAMSWTVIVGGGVFLLRGAAREAIQALANAPRFRRWTGIGSEGAETLTFWGQALLEPIFLIAAAVLTAPFWGFSQREMLTLAGEVLQGFKVGDATISLTGIGLAVLAFVLVLIATRAVQQAMLTRLLPRTRMDAGAQHSLSTGVGYLGVLIGAVVGVSTLGIDLSNLAIVAGALSVGIGFGLQSIVNNFVSGLILLIERPVKVGDWVIVGGQQGIVKRISIRATEVETFDRSSVIIPNSDLITNAVINRTHKDRYGRVDVPVGVAYGSDTRKVESLLLEIGRAQSEVLSIPEPFVVFIAFGESSLDFELRVYTANNLHGIRIATEIRHQVAERFAAEGIEIPFPQRVVHLPKLPPLQTAEREAPKEDGLPPSAIGDDPAGSQAG